MASGKQLLNAIQKIMSGLSDEQSPAQKAITNRQAIQKRNLDTAIAEERALTGKDPTGPGPDLHYFGEDVVEKAQPDFMLELLERAAKDPELAKVAKGTTPSLIDIAEEIGTTTPRPKGHTQVKRLRDINEETLESGQWPSRRGKGKWDEAAQEWKYKTIPGGLLKEEHVKGLESRIRQADKTLAETGTAVGNPKLTDEGPNVFGETAGPVGTAKVRKATPDTRVRDREGALAEYESTKPYDEGTRTAQQLPPGRAKGAGPVDMEGLSPEDSVSRSHISSEELTMDDPKAQEAMLDVFGDETQKEADRIRAIIDDPAHPQLSPNLEREVAMSFAEDSIKAKKVDALAKQAFDYLANVEKGLVLPKGIDDPAVNKQLYNSKRMLHKFRTELARGAETARKENDPEILEALISRLLSPPKGR